MPPEGHVSCDLAWSSASGRRADSADRRASVDGFPLIGGAPSTSASRAFSGIETSWESEQRAWRDCVDPAQGDPQHVCACNPMNLSRRRTPPQRPLRPLLPPFRTIFSGVSEVVPAVEAYVPPNEQVVSGPPDAEQTFVAPPRFLDAIAHTSRRSRHLADFDRRQVVIGK